MSRVRKLDPATVQLGTSARAVGASSVVTDAPAAAPLPQTDAIYKQAYLEGFAAGEEDGQKEAQRQNSQVLTKLQDALGEAEAARRQWQDGIRDAAARFEHACEQQLEAVERLAADLAEIAVHKIVGRLHAERRAVAAVCRETIDALRLEAAQVRISQSDRENFPELPATFEIVVDGSLKPGDCLLRAPFGELDAGVATQLAQLREALRSALAQEHP